MSALRVILTYRLANHTRTRTHARNHTRTRHHGRATRHGHRTWRHLAVATSCGQTRNSRSTAPAAIVPRAVAAATGQCPRLPNVVLLVVLLAAVAVWAVVGGECSSAQASSLRCNGLRPWQRRSNTRSTANRSGLHPTMIRARAVMVVAQRLMYTAAKVEAAHWRPMVMRNSSSSRKSRGWARW